MSQGGSANAPIIRGESMVPHGSPPASFSPPSTTSPSQRRSLFRGLKAGFRRSPSLEDGGIAGSDASSSEWMMTEEGVTDMRLRTEMDAQSIIEDPDEFRRMQSDMREAGIIT